MKNKDEIVYVFFGRYVIITWDWLKNPVWVKLVSFALYSFWKVFLWRRMQTSNKLELCSARQHNNITKNKTYTEHQVSKANTMFTLMDSGTFQVSDSWFIFFDQ